MPMPGQFDPNVSEVDKKIADIVNHLDKLIRARVKQALTTSVFEVPAVKPILSVPSDFLEYPQWDNDVTKARDGLFDFFKTMED